MRAGQKVVQPPAACSRRHASTRREAASSSSMPSSAVASVSTPGVLSTAMSRAAAAARSTWSTPTDSVAIARTDAGSAAIVGACIGSVLQINSASRPAAAASTSSTLIRRSSELRMASNSAASRASTASVSCRVTSTLCVPAMPWLPQKPGETKALSTRVESALARTPTRPPLTGTRHQPTPPARPPQAYDAVGGRAGEWAGAAN